MIDHDFIYDLENIVTDAVAQGSKKTLKTWLYVGGFFATIFGSTFMIILNLYLDSILLDFKELSKNQVQIIKNQSRIEANFDSLKAGVINLESRVGRLDDAVFHVHEFDQKGLKAVVKNLWIITFLIVSIVYVINVASFYHYFWL